MSTEYDAQDTEFSWSDNEAVAVQSVKGIAVYTNPNGEIVIRQENDGALWDHDPFIVIPRERVADVINALQKEVED